jgi:diaminohydroxyphosphoribosylaminopyrimidine deaminase/5-amino-6-(5-phosphoribosylamino)uracil reductase
MTGLSADTGSETGSGMRVSSGRPSLEDDHRFMAEALALAARGAGRTSPNPMVGALLVKDGHVIARAYHQRAGGPHAEVSVLKSAGPAAAGATLYVNLEPCCHYGKTPPCTDAILRAGITRVVCGMQDPNPKVRGEGIRILRSQSVGVKVGVMQQESIRLNEAHIKYVLTGLPLVVLKIAQTLDGKITGPDGSPAKITGPETQAFVHQLRNRYDAVLVGKNTVLADDPQLTVRAIKGRDPLRLVLDSWEKIPYTAGVLANNLDKKTIMVSLAIAGRPNVSGAVENFRWRIPPNEFHQIDLHRLLEIAGENQITGILVEGGAEVFGSFLRERLADKIHLILAPTFFGEGKSTLAGYRLRTAGGAVELADTDVVRLGRDLMITGYPVWEDNNPAPREPEA